MIERSVWVHGNVALPQETDPDRLIDFGGVKWSALLGIPRGAGREFRGKQRPSDETVWFHFPISTPCFRDDLPDQSGGHARAILVKAFLLFGADNGVTVRAMHIWDGGDRRAIRNFTLAGNHSHISSANQWDITERPQIYTGINLSFEVQFGLEGSITFHAAGADFVYQ